MRAERALIVELGAASRAFFHDLNSLDPRRVEGEELLNAHAVCIARNREVARDIVAAVVDSENLAFKILNAELVAFFDFDRDADDIASAEIRKILSSETSGLFGVDFI